MENRYTDPKQIIQMEKFTISTEGICGLTSDGDTWRLGKGVPHNAIRMGWKSCNPEQYHPNKSNTWDGERKKKKATTPGEKIPVPVAENRDMRYTRPEYEGLGTKGNMDKDTQGEKENMYYGPWEGGINEERWEEGWEEY